MIEEDYIGKQTTVDYRGDLRFRMPWCGYANEEVFTILRKLKQVYICSEILKEKNILLKIINKLF